MTLLSDGFLGAVYLIFLLYLFLGISIIADIFMEAIEVITSKTQRIEVTDKSGKNKYFMEVPMWNPTIANLTLMALGSSAPEILLAIIETCGSLGEVAGELGPSTIVGSAAFNLLVITAVCIPSVQEPKKIFDTGVFITTAVFSVFAYLWLYAVLSLISPGEVQISEAWITLGFMIALVILAFGMDRWNAYKIKMSKNESDKLKDQYD